MRIQWWWAIKLRQCKWRCRILPHWSNLTFMASVYNIHPLTFIETTQCEFKRWLSFYNLEISLIQKEAHLAFHAVNVDPRGNLENLFNIYSVVCLCTCVRQSCVLVVRPTRTCAHIAQCTSYACKLGHIGGWVRKFVADVDHAHSLTHWLMLIHMNHFRIWNSQSSFNTL